MGGLTLTNAGTKTPVRAATIVVITLVVYIPALRAGFIWNDESVGSLLGNIVFRDSGLYRVWFTTESLNYWPMVWTSFWAEHQLWGFHPAGYHAVNVLVHAVSALLVWRVLVRLEIPGAWLAALLFAVHPVNVESVAWITQRKNTLCLLFFLASLIAYLRFEDVGSKRWYLAALASFALAMLSKGAAAGLPIVLLIVAWWRRGRIGRLDVARSLPFLAVLAVMCVVEIWFQHQRAMGGAVARDDTFWARLAGAGWVVWFYLYKTVLPLNLCFVYTRWEIEPAKWISFLPNVCLLFLFVACLWARRGWGRPILFGLSFFVVTLGPALGFVDFFFMKYSFVADHYQYVSMVGVLALVVGASARAAERYGLQTAYSCGAVVVVAGLSVLTWRQCHVYENEEVLWLDTIRRNPTAWIAHNNLAVIRELQGRPHEARAGYRNTLKIKPDHTRAHLNLGRLERQFGRLERAIMHYREAVRIAPRFAAAHRILGRALASAGRRDEAVMSFHRGLRINSNDASLHLELSVALASSGQLHEAIDHLRTAVRLEPGNGKAHYNLGIALIDARKGNPDAETISSFRRAVALSPDYFESRVALAQTLMRIGSVDEALVHLTEAHRIRPRSAATLSLKAWILATHPDPRIRDPIGAVAAGERAVELTGRRSTRALDALAAAYAEAGRFDEAVATEQQSLKRVGQGVDPAQRQEMSDRLETYRRKLPHRDDTFRRFSVSD